ncbi:hypothetical protein LSG31_08100 [Fodinisporobacter ferrooxydans]|uniref:Uncharacterized protein n=1 Tax=Fodinisporobacter ferrooxydans TaxID=2901836 RepID=A0ABY4CRB5_9BACL|nr:hypothetical protein LSG31_08100 [Alicyclobacillaceae bacterium MYW30-H2]
MTLVKLLLYFAIPVCISLYTINFGRWLLSKENRYGGMCTIGLGILAIILPIVVVWTKQMEMVNP